MLVLNFLELSGTFQYIFMTVDKVSVRLQLWVNVTVAIRFDKEDYPNCSPTFSVVVGRIFHLSRS